MPNQLSANFNGMLYAGFRNDVFKLRYRQNPIGEVERSIGHLGISIGGFAGIGSEPVNPWVTRDRVEAEYEGVAFSAGLACLAGFNNVNAGLAVGFDRLLDGNRRFWIYEQRPWVGLALGINLN